LENFTVPKPLLEQNQSKNRPKMHQKHKIDQNCGCWNSVPIGKVTIGTFRVLINTFEVPIGTPDFGSVFVFLTHFQAFSKSHFIHFSL